MKKIKMTLFAVAMCLFCSDSIQAQTGKYKLIFRDEFNLPDGSSPDPKVWSSSRRENSTWGRWIGTSGKTAFIKRGRLVCRAIPNNGVAPGDTAKMLTGAVETRGKFAFKYGKIEVRMRTRHHRGNFPAAWLMPQPPCKPWPYNGEIDIFETIDNEDMSQHTAHSGWTQYVNKKEKHGFSKTTKVEKWHVYGLEWTPEYLAWTVDGKYVGTYRKSADADALAQGQWPFDHEFYIILNQSVGRKGGWAAEADTTHTYETQFDWVRVYQLEQ